MQIAKIPAGKIGHGQMSEDYVELVAAMDGMSRCLQDVERLSAHVEQIPRDELHESIQRLAGDGHGPEVSLLLSACAYSEITLDPNVLCEAFGVVEDIVDVGACFSFQDASAVAPLLCTAGAEHLSWQRQALAARLATELAVKHGGDSEPVRHTLHKLVGQIREPQSESLLYDSLAMLDYEEGEAERGAALPLLTETDIREFLPDRKPRTVIGGEYSVRRPIPKLSRNAPCHCGSGRKYKKCCYEKDRELLRDASQYEGHTREEVRAHPGLVDDPAVIDGLRAHELKKLDLAELSHLQLIAGYRRASTFGLRELAFDMLRVADGREAFDSGHFDDLLHDVIVAGDLPLAQKIRAHMAERGYDLWRADEVAFEMEVLERPERYAPLDERCAAAVRGVEEDFDGLPHERLVSLAHGLAPRHPGLATMFARAAIGSCPRAVLDNEALLDVIYEARAELGLEPWGDPAEAMFEWGLDREYESIEAAGDEEDFAQLRASVDGARRDLDAKTQELRRLQADHGRLATELADAKEAAERATTTANTSSREPSAGTPDSDGAQSDPAAMERLRRKVEELKGEISSQQEQRRRLRKELQREKRRGAAVDTATPEDTGEALDTPVEYEEPSGPLLLPDYTDTFRRSCASAPRPVVSKALRTVAGFASHDRQTWRHAKRMQAMPNLIRVRVGIHFRLLIEWKPGQSLRILDLVRREDLESWVRRHKNA